jgi:MOSC domain-containing protein YiiM
MGKIVSINISEKKGTVKLPVNSAILKEDYGIVGDAHAGDTIRQISLLDSESIKEAKERGISVDMGDFAENITTEGIDLLSLNIGDELTVGNGLLQITQIGKKCHQMCEVGRRVGDCIMPRRGIFAKVIKGADIKVGDPIQ